MSAVGLIRSGKNVGDAYNEIEKSVTLCQALGRWSTQGDPGEGGEDGLQPTQSQPPLFLDGIMTIVLSLYGMTTVGAFSFMQISFIIRLRFCSLVCSGRKTHALNVTDSTHT